jgi:type VI secretion system protein ImpF
MASRTAQQEEAKGLRSEADRLQPALLDRLTDDEPEQKREPPRQAVISKSNLKRHVLRDLGWLFNTTSHHVTDELDDYPEVRNSVINYGIPPLAGRQFSGIDWSEFERALHQAVLSFEPRIVPESLKVTALTPVDRLSHHNQLQFEVRGEVWSVPFPIELLLRSQLDLETGQVTVSDQLSGGLG